jgi:formyl-CoA transferase
LPGISPSNTYPCAQGGYVVIAGNADGIFKRLMRAIGRADLAEDPALAHNNGRAAQNDRLDAAITAWTETRTVEQILSVMEAASVPAGRIYTARDIAEDPHFAARDMIERHALPDGQPIDLPGIVPKLSATPGATRWVGPELGEHTREVLASIGIEGAAFARLCTSATVFAAPSEGR